jgi:hypothetical protein
MNSNQCPRRLHTVHLFLEPTLLSSTGETCPVILGADKLSRLIISLVKERAVLAKTQ